MQKPDIGIIGGADILKHMLTDGTDAFDTLYIGCEKFPYREIMPYTSSGVLKQEVRLGNVEITEKEIVTDKTFEI